MSLKIDRAKKTADKLVLEKRVPLRIQGKNYVYLMTNDFTVVAGKLRSFGCRMPKNKEFVENHSLAKNVQAKMINLGANWSLTVTSNLAVLNYFDAESQTFYIVFLEKLTADGSNSSIVKMFNCVFENKVNEIKNLVKLGYDVDQGIEGGATPLMLACSIDACDSVKTLVEFGANINAVDANGQTPLMYTTFKNSVYSAKFLLSCKGIKLDEKNIAGETALQMSVSFFSDEVFQYLVQAGADINTVDYSGMSPLAVSIKKKNWTISRKLIEYGADVNFSDKMGRTPLIFSAQYDNVIVVQDLINAGADITIKDINENTALLVAAEHNSYKVLKKLIDSHDFSDYEFIQAVVKSAMKGFVDATNVLLENSLNKKEMAFAALVSACLKNHADIIHVCMDYDCDVNGSLYFGMTPLMIACYVNAEKAVLQLIAYDADINRLDENGMTALMYAACKNNLKILIALQRNGADKSVKDKCGKTFEDYAKSFDKRTYSQMVLERISDNSPKFEEKRKDDIPHNPQPFIERFDWYIQKYWERFPNNKQSDIYKKAGLSKQTFSKIISNRKRDFHPKKDTVIQLAIGLRLTFNEAEDLLQSSGYAFSEYDKKDVEMKCLFCEQNYNLFDWNDRMRGVTGKVFFKAFFGNEDCE